MPVHVMSNIGGMEQMEMDLQNLFEKIGPKQTSSRSAPVRKAREILLEQELEASHHDLQSAVRDLAIAIEEQKAVNEEAMSVNEEFQSTNEELEAAKEELQSLNEELTALNGQLHETVEQQRETANDLQNILVSTDVATLFLDADLKIRPGDESGHMSARRNETR